MIEWCPGVRRMGRSRAQHGEKKQCDRGYRAHELPLLDDLSKLDVMALFEYKANRRHCKEFVRRVYPEFLVFARFLTADERKTGGGLSWAVESRQAEGTGFEPATGCPAPHFQSTDDLRIGSQ